MTVSDERLQLEVLNLRKTNTFEGRVLVHGEDEGTGRTDSMIESVDGRLLFVNHTPELVEARAKGKMRPDSFIRVDKAFVDGKPRLAVQDFGKADSLLRNKPYFAQRAQAAAMRNARGNGEIIWKGWLGSYQQAMISAEARRALPCGRISNPFDRAILMHRCFDPVR